MTYILSIEVNEEEFRALTETLSNLALDYHELYEIEASSTGKKFYKERRDRAIGLLKVVATAGNMLEVDDND